MNEQRLDSVARSAAALVFGRRSFVGIGGIAFAAGILGQSAGDTQSKRKRKKKNPCLVETERCVDVAQGLNVPPENRDRIIACCGCDVPTVLSCLSASSGEMRP